MSRLKYFPIHFKKIKLIQYDGDSFYSGGFDKQEKFSVIAMQSINLLQTSKSISQ